MTALFGRLDVELEDNLTGGIHLEDPTRGVFPDERIAILEALARVGAAAFSHLGLEMEHDFVIRCDLRDAAVGIKDIATSPAFCSQRTLPSGERIITLPLPPTSKFPAGDPVITGAVSAARVGVNDRMSEEIQRDANIPVNPNVPGFPIKRSLR
jgi:hypothetical protein